MNLSVPEQQPIGTLLRRSTFCSAADCLVSSSNLQPSAKRRRLNPAAIVPVPVYSSRVSRSLQLKPTACLLGGRENSATPRRNRNLGGSDPNPQRTSCESDGGRFCSVWTRRRYRSIANVSVCPRGHAGCPSPPPPESPVQKQSSKARRKISEINKKLQAVSAILSPEPLERKTDRRRNRRNQRSDPNDDSDDVIIMSPGDGSDSPREIPLKIRCRTDVHKVLVLPNHDWATCCWCDPDQNLVRIHGGSWVGPVEDECVVMPSEEQSCSSSCSSSCISVKLQSRDRSSSQLFFVHRVRTPLPLCFLIFILCAEAPLSSVFSQYLSRLPASARRSVRFHFDGSKVAGSQTAAQLELEDGDIIEVWT
ncbi:hypothetical protein CCH79_00020468 [Gambusia affinis]|uniref:NFATC2-interacting protein n=1 Tax=Gambusia affinis TaxID=33528 RepID=A0A315W3M6_GAMAF|nr:hypothetical protein CCH79_00020468 [Gambusia affinis]